MILGFRTVDQAASNRVVVRDLSSQQRMHRWQEKESVYQEYEDLHPEVVDDLVNLDRYKVFWRDWIVSCPAWRSDRVSETKSWCGAMAILIHQDEEGSLIFCPECLYAGELFAA